MNIQRFVLLLLLVTGSSTAFHSAQVSQVNGAWQLRESSGRTVMLTMADNYLMKTTYEPSRYVSSRGGTYQLDGETLNVLIEFDTEDSNRVGQTEPYQIRIRNNQLHISNPAGTRTYNRVEEIPTPLTGLWRITSRANDTGQLTAMQRGPRKTIKLMTESRFQWVALNGQTKQFFGTGGGTYTLNNGRYIETIDFFSRDNSRVGRSLPFQAVINSTEWQHTGQSSTGGPVNEIWSREK